MRITGILLFLAGFWAGLGALPLIAAQVPPADPLLYPVLLVNRQVPLGGELAARYADFYKIPETRIIVLDLPVEEVIGMDAYLELLAAPLRRHLKPLLEQKLHPVVLNFYGVPLSVRDGKRLRLVDRLVSLLFREDPLDGRLVLNPYWRREVVFNRDLPILLCTRLDAPTPALAEKLLEAWISHSRLGPWKRYLVPESASEVRSLLEEKALIVHSLEEVDSFPEGQVQWALLPSEQLKRWHAEGKKVVVGGAVLLDDDGRRPVVEGRLRSTGESDVAAALLSGAAFYIGQHTPREAYEDIFEMPHFIRRFTFGESFASATHGSLAQLGGGVLIIGDPLARPFQDDQLAYSDEYYGTPGEDFADREALSRFSEVKDWWLAHDALLDWHGGRMSLAIGKLRGAIHLRKHSSIFYQLLCSFLEQSGQTEALARTLELWQKKGLEKGDTERIEGFRPISAAEEAPSVPEKATP